MLAKYRICIDPVPLEHGGGFLARVPDLPGCIADGRSAEEAVGNLKTAYVAWIETARVLGREIPPAASHMSRA